jgi:hypothetical protein
MAHKLNRSFFQFAALGFQDPADGFEGGRLPGAVGAEESDNAVFRHRQGDSLENQNDVIVNDLDVLYLKHPLPPPGAFLYIRSVPG